MKKSESLEGIITRIQEIKEKYYRELRKEIEKKGIKLPSSFSLFVTDSEVMFLEEFAEMNKLVDTKRIWKKYEKEFLNLTNLMIERMKEKMIERIEILKRDK